MANKSKALYLVKIGGSVITNASIERSANMAAIKRLAGEVKEGMGQRSLIVGHGSGSFAHMPAHRYRVNEGLVNGESLYGSAVTHNVAAELNRIVASSFIDSSIPAITFSPSTGAIAENGKIVSWDISAMLNYLKKGFLPLTYGDVVFDKSKGVSIAPTEEVLRHIASITKPSMVIIGTDVDGIFTSDPSKDPDAELIRYVDSSNIGDVINAAGASNKVDVTGGMRTKAAILYSISESTGARCQILNACKPGILRKALLGEGVTSTLINAGSG
jgi:isopentenyl phosphate kinase